MPELTVIEALERIDLPVEPSSEFADGLLSSLLDELEDAEAPTSARERSGERHLIGLPRVLRPAPRGPSPTWFRVAVAAVVTVLVVAFELVLIRPFGGNDALAVMRAARDAFANVPAFHATTMQRTPGPWLQEEAPGLQAPVPDMVVTRDISYLDATHFRNTVTGMRWDVRAPAWLLSQLAPELGEYHAADGRYFAHYLPSETTYTVEPIGDPRDLRSFAAGPLLPRVEAMAQPGDAYLADHCTVLPDATIVGRTAHHLHCTDPGSRQYEGGPTLDVDTYVDAETGMLLEMTSRNEGVWFEVTSLDLQPDVSSDDFTLIVPEGASVQWLGDGSPPDRFTTTVDASVTSIAIGNVPEGVAAGAGSIWVTYTQGGTGGDGEGGKQAVARIDPATNEVVARIVAPTDLTEIPKGWISPLVFISEVLPTDEGVFIAYHDAGNGGPPVRIAAIDPRTNTLGPPLLTLDRSANGLYGASMAFLDGSLWVCDAQGGDVYAPGTRSAWPMGAVLQVDPRTGEVQRRIPIDGSCGEMLAVDGSLWFRGNPASEAGRSLSASVLFEVDPATGRVTSFPLPRGSGTIAYGDGSFWIEDYLERQVVRFDTGQERILAHIATEVPTGIGDAAVAWGQGYAWETNSADNSLLTIDPVTDQVIRTIKVGSSPLALVVAEGSIWIANYRDATVSRVTI